MYEITAGYPSDFTEVEALVARTIRDAFDHPHLTEEQRAEIHIADRLLSLNDGPPLDALKQLHGTTIKLPTRKRDYPDRNRLSHRFEAFRALGGR
jgi:hypothetical protein